MLRTHHRPGRITAARWIGTALAVCLSVAACGSSTSSSGAGGTSGSGPKTGDTFTFAISAQPTLNPYTADQNPYNQWVLALAYAPLIKQQSDLTYTGGLAESFHYTDDHNTVFEMKLRPNLKFADGSSLDAPAVVASLKYFLSSGVSAKTFGGTISDITATDPLTVRVTNKTPNPEMPFVFSQSALAGMIISPAGLATPDKLGTATFGAGPYVLDLADSAVNSHYVFTPNPKYWNRAEIHWKKVVALEIPDPNSSVKALRAGQVDYIASAVNLLPEIKAAGLAYSTAPAGVVGVSLADRDGTIAAPLRSQAVRQALNYAIDRQSILGALFAGYGAPTDELNSPGWTGYDPASNNRYPYDPAKAKQLLADAGYPNGFELTMLAEQFIGQDLVAQTLIAQWAKIGVTVHLTTDAQIPQAVQHVMSRQFPVVPFLALNSTAYLLSTSFMLPIPNPGNPFVTSDAQLNALLAQAAATADAAGQNALYQQAMTRLVDLAWFAPVVTIDGVAAGNARITGWKGNLFDVTSVRPA